MDDRQQLLSAREHLHMGIRASEEWQPSYKEDADSFDMLIRLEARLETAVAEYLHEASTRAPGYVDWSALPSGLQADAGPVRNNDDPVWEVEQTYLTQAVLEIITELIATGGLAAEAKYEIPVGYTSLHEAVMEAARKHTAGMVKGVTETTRKLIRESVAKSIALGEDTSLATERLMETIDNPIRAELIAQTEPVNAYQTGYSMYAKSTGAKQKTWDGLAGACQFCSPLIGKTIPIDDQFELPNGKLIDHPAAHPRCRCSVIYLY